MTPDKAAGGPGTTPDPPSVSPTSKTYNARIVSDAAAQRRLDDPQRRYAAAYHASREAIAQRAQAAGELAATPADVIEILGLARAAMHAEVDFLVDIEVDRWRLARIPGPRDARTS